MLKTLKTVLKKFLIRIRLRKKAKWSEIPDDMKLRIIQMLDANARANLSQCSSKHRQLIGDFPMRREIKLCSGYCSSESKWYTEYACKNEWCDTFADPVRKYFDTREEALERVKRMLKMARHVCNVKLNYSFEKSIVSEIELLSLQTSSVDLTHSEAITVAGLVQLLQRLIMNLPSNSCYFLERVNPDVIKYLIEDEYESCRTDITLTFNSRFDFSYVYFKIWRTPFNSKIRMGQRKHEPGNVPIWHRTTNAKTMIAYPSLENFVELVREGLPAGFPMFVNPCVYDFVLPLDE